MHVDIYVKLIHTFTTHIYVSMNEYMCYIYYIQFKATNEKVKETFIVCNMLFH